MEMAARDTTNRGDTQSLIDNREFERLLIYLNSSV
jgi:hypothetical protein